MSIHEKIVNDVYAEKYATTEGVDYDLFIASLDLKERLAVLTGNLNYQVTNGGFFQWHENGYSSQATNLILTLTLYKNIPVISRVTELVQEADRIIDKMVQEVRDADGYEEEEYVAEKYMEKLDILDNSYYEINEEFLIAIENILQKV